MRQPLGVVGEVIRVQSLHGVHQMLMERASPISHETAIRDFVGQGVPECVYDFGKDALLIEKFCGLEIREGVVQRGLRHLRNDLKEGEGDLLADDRRGLEQALLVRR
jgi:hypothetical protein